MSTSGPATPDPAGRRDAPPPRGSGDRKRASGFDDEGHLKSSRSGAVYIGLIAAAVLAIVVLIFIIQNSDETTIRFLGFQGSLPLGVGVLLAVIAGMLIVALPGSMRIYQLRRSLTKNEKRTRDAD